MQTLGYVTLNIALVGYLLWFIPQLLHTARQRSVSGLSLGMHLLLFATYLSDFSYGFGLHMPWQYRLVTCAGLFSLSYQHYQFYRYGQDRTALPSATCAVIMMGLLSFASVFYTELSVRHYNYIGLLTGIFWISFAVPQIMKNYRLKSANSISRRFILLNIVVVLCDSVSAWTLHWNYPSKITFPLALLESLILLWQCYQYRSREPSYHASTSLPAEAYD